VPSKRINFSKRILRENGNKEKTKRRFREKEEINGREGKTTYGKVIINLEKAILIL